MNTTYQVGSAIGLAGMVALAGATTADLAAAGASAPAALSSGFASAFLWSSVVALAAAALAAWRVRSSPAAAPAAPARTQPAA